MTTIHKIHRRIMNMIKNFNAQNLRRHFNNPSCLLIVLLLSKGNGSVNLSANCLLEFTNLRLTSSFGRGLLENDAEYQY